MMVPASTPHPNRPLVLPRQVSSSRRTALLSRPDGSGEPSYVTKLLTGVIVPPSGGVRCPPPEGGTTNRNHPTVATLSGSFAHPGSWDRGLLAYRFALAGFARIA